MTIAFMQDKPRYAKYIDSPLGSLLLLAGDKALCELRLPGEDKSLPEGVVMAETPLLLAVKRQLGEYFAGLRKSFDLPLAPAGSKFCLACWRQLLNIEYGRLSCYADEAEAVGCKSARAVGQANARNPLPIIIPCHRVVAKDGGLGGYSGGLEMKKFLLSLEGSLKK